MAPQKQDQILQLLLSLKPDCIDTLLISLNTIASIKNQIEYLQKGVREGILELSETTKRMEEMKRSEFREKEKAVLQVHKNKITKCNIMSHGKEKTKYQTRCCGKRPRLDSYEALILYLYSFYFEDSLIEETDYSFEAIFEEALQHKARTEEPSQNTLDDYRNSFKSFITDDLRKRDIRKITPSEIKEYIQAETHRQAEKLGHKMSKKRLYKLKGIFNLVFEYAVDFERQYISYNPVPSNNKIYKKNISVLAPRPEEKAFQPNDIDQIRTHLWKRVNERQYDSLGYAILLSSYTGMREGEIPSLKWSDIDFDMRTIHIHSQQLCSTYDGKKIYEYAPYTKNEKGVSQGGRYFPFEIGDNIYRIFTELKAKQELLSIESEWVFTTQSGEWLKKDGYSSALYYLCKGNPTKHQTGLGLTLSNNHAFRMAINSYEFIPKGLNEVERARLLGHSPEVNLKHYTFSKSNEYIDELREKLTQSPVPQFSSRYPNIIAFPGNTKSPENRGSQGIS